MNYFEIEEKVIENLKTGLIVIPILLWLISIGYSLIHWFKYGVWNQLTSCGLLNLFCYNDTEFIGLNKILDWFGQNNFCFVVVIVCFIVFHMLPEK